MSSARDAGPGACIPSRAAGAMMNGAVRCPRGRGRCGSFAPRTESPDKRSPSASPSWHIPPAIIYTRLFSCCLFFLSFSSKIFHSPPFPFVPLLRVPWLPFPSRPDTFTSVIQDSRRAIPAILSGRHKVEVLTPAIHLKVRCQRSAVALTEIASAALTATSILSFSPTLPCCCRISAGLPVTPTCESVRFTRPFSRTETRAQPIHSIRWQASLTFTPPPSAQGK